jgi:hypothetical protein
MGEGGRKDEREGKRGRGEEGGKFERTFLPFPAVSYWFMLQLPFPSHVQAEGAGPEAEGLHRLAPVEQQVSPWERRGD